MRHSLTPYIDTANATSRRGSRLRSGLHWPWGRTLVASPKQQEQGQADHKTHAHHPEHIIVGQHHRLPMYGTSQEFQRAILCHPWRHTAAGQAPCETVNDLGGPHVVRREMIDQAGAMKGRPMGDLVGHKGITDVAPNAA